VDTIGAAGVSSREAEVLAAVGEHLTNAQIARRLHLSVRTVESHVSSLLRKFGVADRQALATLAPAFAAAPPPGPADGLAGLPSVWTSFVGRDRERAAVRASLGAARLVTLVGPGGVGKTRLALAVTQEVGASFPFGGGFVGLVSVRPGFLTQAVAAVLGVAERPGQALQQAVAERLGHGRCLLVLDNCEHLLDAVAELVASLLADCPQLVVLTTSRERLGVAGERVLPVAPLALVAEGAGRGSASEAELLFRDRAASVGAQLDADADAEVVAELCSRLEGMPLSIELAVARVGSLGVDGLKAGIGDQLRLLAGGRSADERHRSLRAVLDWSHDLLDEDERALFRQLSVFVGGFDLDAVCRVATDCDAGAAADLVGRLTDKSLLVHHHDPGGSRWRMLDSIRAYAVERLAAAGEQPLLRHRHLQWAAEAAAHLERRLEAGQAWLPEFDLVADDLRAALTGTGPVPDATAHSLARPLAHLTFARRFFVEARAHYRAAADRAGDAAAAGRDLRDGAAAAVIVSDGPASFALLLDAAERARAAGDRNAQAAALAEAVTVTVRYPAGFGGEVPAERRSELLREATAAADTDPATAALLAAARAWHERGDATATLALSRTAVQAARQADAPELIAAALDALSVAALRAGQFREVHRIADERMRIVAALAAHQPTGAAEITDAYHVAASAALAVGDLPAARTAIQQARRHDPIGGHPYLSAPRLVRVLTLSGRFDEASDAAQTLWDNWVRDGSPAMAWMSSSLAAAALVHGLRDDGRYELWRSRALTLAGCDDPTGCPNLMAIMAFVEARLATHSGDVVRAAETLVERADAAFPERWWEGYARAAGAELAVVAGLPDAAGRLARIEPLAAEHRWAAACLDRARGRLERDPDAIVRALTRWERLDARFERACTLLLLPGREPEGQAELQALGCPPPKPRVVGQGEGSRPRP
jgi:predicted ATPase/DNA-binding CsgD family transcriptional regulator